MRRRALFEMSAARVRHTRKRNSIDQPTHPYISSGRSLLFPRLFQTQTSSSSSRDGEGIFFGPHEPPGVPGPKSGVRPEVRNSARDPEFAPGRLGVPARPRGVNSPLVCARCGELTITYTAVRGCRRRIGAPHANPIERRRPTPTEILADLPHAPEVVAEYPLRGQELRG